jgi:uncharacterized protein YkwD
MRYVLAGAALAAAIVVLTTGEVAAQPSPAPIDRAGATARVLDLTNTERGKAGLAPLTLSDELQSSAQAYTLVLASSDCFAHTCGPMPNFADRDAAAGYDGWWSLGENLAGGYPTPEEVMAGWMASPGHRGNILSVTFTEIGIGVTRGGGRFSMYWAEEFGARELDDGD